MIKQLDIFGDEAAPAQKAGRVWSNKKRSSPRHSNTVRRVLRVGQMAWEGRSAGEIADEIGVGTQYVYQLCSDYRIKLAPKTRSQYSFRLTLQLADLYGLERAAARLEMDVGDMCAKLLGVLSVEHSVVANLLEAGDE